MTITNVNHDPTLVAHLLRRAAFGSTPAEFDRAVEQGFDHTLHQLLNPDHKDEIPEDLIRRYHVELSDLRSSGGAYWMYRLVMTDTPLREKMCVFWHRLFATAVHKLIQNKVGINQIDMFRAHGMGRFDNLLLELSKDPAMIMCLDNQDNHASNINENFGREILELFSMGVGNYTEDDIKETARAFTGWRIVNPEYMSIRMRNNTARPYGYMSWEFEYDDDDHDHGQKTILGQTGKWNGEDAVRIICEQDATARYLARHMYHFFVADEFPVPQWPHEAPKDPDAINLMVQAYIDSDHSVKEMLKAMFESEFFKDTSSRFARIKSPVEMVVGTMRLAGPIDLPANELFAAEAACGNMGQGLLRPPSVEGWQGGSEWINTGAYVERINFASRILSDPNKKGVRDVINRIKSFSQTSEMHSDDLVDYSLSVLGPLDALDSTRQGLKRYASKFIDLSWRNEDQSAKFDEAAVSIIQLVVSTQEYQTV